MLNTTDKQMIFCSLSISFLLMRIHMYTQYCLQVIEVRLCHYKIKSESIFYFFFNLIYSAIILFPNELFLFFNLLERERERELLD